MMRLPERARLTDLSDASYGNNGAFLVDSPRPGWQLFFIASDGDDPMVPEAKGWEHVSVRAVRGQQSRIPAWDEMCHVKDLCWSADDVVMQLHPAKRDYINCHPHVLHLWRHANIPTPPSSLNSKTLPASSKRSR